MYKLLILLLVFPLCSCEFSDDQVDNKYKTELTIASVGTDTIIINEEKLLDLLEYSSNNGFDSIINWTNKNLIIGQKIIKGERFGIVCDRAIYRVDTNGQPINGQYILPYNNNFNYALGETNCALFSVFACPYGNNPIQIEIRTLYNY